LVEVGSQVSGGDSKALSDFDDSEPARSDFAAQGFLGYADAVCGGADGE
jgi:hypothetical protein